MGTGAEPAQTLLAQLPNYLWVRRHKKKRSLANTSVCIILSPKRAEKKSILKLDCGGLESYHSCYLKITETKKISTSLFQYLCYLFIYFSFPGNSLKWCRTVIYQKMTKSSDIFSWQIFSRGLGSWGMKL